MLRGLRDPLARKTIMGEFKPVEDSTIGELSVNFDLVLGVTAFEDDAGVLRGVAPARGGRR